MSASSTAATAAAYQSAAARVALIYQMATIPGSPRTLLLTVPGSQPLGLEGWDGPVTCDFVGYDPRRLERYAAESFERVALHRALDRFVAFPGRRRSREGQASVLAEVQRILVPGGVVTGCVSNLVHPNEPIQGTVFGHTGASCERMLGRAGFQRIRVSIALPSGDAPQNLVSVDRRAASHYFRLQLGRSGEQLSVPSRTGRRLLVEAGLTRNLQGSLVFFGRRPC